MVLVVVLFVLALVLLAWRSWRCAAVRPPYRVQNRPEGHGQEGRGRDPGWDWPTRNSGTARAPVRLLTWLHVAVVGSYLACVGVTARALAGATPRRPAVLGWTGIALGAAAITLAVAYVCLDALDTPSMDTPDAEPTLGTLTEEEIRGLVMYLLVPAGV